MILIEAIVFALVIKLSYQQCVSYYTVKPGDTCYEIIRTYNLNEANFYAANGNINCYNLQIGQLICLRSNHNVGYTSPGFLSSSGYYGCSNPYSVKQGDTCYEILISYGLDSTTFNSLNPGINCNLLQIGQTICLTNKFGVVYNTGYGCANPYTVKAGDTCYQIMTYYGQSYSTFFAGNPGINCNLLQIGQILCLSVTPGPYTGSSQTITYSYGYGCANRYTIKSGDTCSGLISNYGLDSTLFYSVNPNINCYNLQIGQIICLGTNQGHNHGQSFSSGYGCSNSYTVKQSDTCYDIASSFGLNLALLYSANPGINCNLLQIGQSVCLGPSYGATIIPSSTLAPTTTTTTTISTTTSSFCTSNNDCQNFGICLRTKCMCPNGYTGVYCETFDINLLTDEPSSIPCSFDNPCLNQGSCFVISNSYRCSCTSPFIGIKCEVVLTSLSPATTTMPSTTSSYTTCPFQNPCRNSATCVLVNTTYMCICSTGFSGTFCEISDATTVTTTPTTTTSAMKLCPFTNPCKNQGVCMIQGNSYFCLCPTSFTGNFCETSLYSTTTRTLSCNPNPCYNNGFCLGDSNGVFESCICQASFAGSFCEARN
jgi:LysM repeat protein